MKPISSLFCAILLGTTALAAMPVVSQAAGIGPGEDALSVGVGVGVLIGQQDDDRRHRHDNDGRRQGDHRDNGNNGNNGGNDRRDSRDNHDNRDNRDNGNYQQRDMRGGGYDRDGGEQRDDRINRAMAIGRSQGRVLNAWPQGGSLFMVRVDTPRGRVDIIIDVDSGRIVGER